MDDTILIAAAAAIYSFFSLATFLFLLRAGQPGFIRRIRQCGVALFWPLYWLVVPGPLMALRLGSQLLSIVAFLMCLPVILAGFGLSYVFARLSLVGLAPRWMCEDQ